MAKMNHHVPSTLLTTLTLLLSLSACRGQTERHDTFTNCSNGQLLRSAYSFEQFILHVVLDQQVTTANCSWVITPPGHNDQYRNPGNTLYFHQAALTALCGSGALRVYNKEPGANGSAVLVGSACTDVAFKGNFSGRPGYPTLITWTSSNVQPSQRNVSLLTYSSTAWGGGGFCPANFTKVLTTSIGGNEVQYDVGSYVFSDYLPRGLSCYWYIASPDGGVVTMTLTDSLNASPDCTQADNYCTVRERRGGPVVMTVDMCQPGVGASHTSTTGELFIEYHNNPARVMAPKFSLEVKSVDMCSTDEVFMVITPGQTSALKGVSDPATSTECRWTIQAQDDGVVMVDRLDNEQFLQGHCGADDYVSAGEDGSINLCDNSSLPLFASGYRLHLQLHKGSALGGSRRTFVLYYKWVKVLPACQGRQLPYIAYQSEWIFATAVNQSVVPYIGPQCRWVFMPKKDGESMTTRVTIDLPATSPRPDIQQLRNCSLWTARFPAIREDNNEVVPASCGLDPQAVTLTFTSSAPSWQLTMAVDHGSSANLPPVLVEFRRGSHGGPSGPSGPNGPTGSGVMTSLGWRVCAAMVAVAVVVVGGASH